MILDSSLVEALTIFHNFEQNAKKLLWL